MTKQISTFRRPLVYIVMHIAIINRPNVETLLEVSYNISKFRNQNEIRQSVFFNEAYF